MENKNKRRELIGKVKSNKMDKTIVVMVSRKIPHKVYKKYVNKTKKYYAHDPQNLCSAGDIVLIEESKPLSRLKRWRVKEIQEKAIK
jgi:small subunit ribosomal protein S17